MKKDLKDVVKKFGKVKGWLDAQPEPSEMGQYLLLMAAYHSPEHFIEQRAGDLLVQHACEVQELLATLQLVSTGLMLPTIADDGRLSFVLTAAGLEEVRKQHDALERDRSKGGGR